ncbi:MAG: outer rane transport energization protein ExbD [Acidobacteriaceae bacterium]|nr:outer rane transport energization protein ExbD [Acidobacteriaceae bacterium]
MAFSTAGRGPLRAEINITPMIDILLVLIIVFMVVVSMSQEKGLEAQIPQPANEKSPPQPERTIVIQVAWAGNNQQPSLKINDDEVKWEQLHDRLSEIFTGRVERVAFVKGDDDVDFEFVADAIDIARTSGVQRIGLLTRTGPETP